jgi:hypothetical protein
MSRIYITDEDRRNYRKDEVTKQHDPLGFNLYRSLAGEKSAKEGRRRPLVEFIEELKKKIRHMNENPVHALCDAPCEICDSHRHC